MSMTLETAKRLHDVRNACREIREFSVGRTRNDMLTDRTFQLVVERLLEIVGEGLRQAEHSDPAIMEHIPDIRDIIGTRNRPIHGYDDINDNLLWDIVDGSIPSLEAQVVGLLREAPDVESR